MSIESATKLFTDKDRGLEFEYPSDWVLNDGISLNSTSLQVYHPKPQDGFRPTAFIEIFNSDNSPASELERIVSELQANSKNFKLHDKKIRNEGDRRGGILYQYEQESIDIICQKVLVPMADGRLLEVTAITALSSWKQFSQQMMMIVNSARLLESKQNSELEIVYDYAPQAQTKDYSGQVKKKADNLSLQGATPLQTAVGSFSFFAERYRKEWKKCLIKDDLKEILKEEDLAVVLWAALGSYVKNWISEPIASLNGRTVLQCIKDPTALKQLKALLLNLDEKGSNIRQLQNSTDLTLIKISPTEVLASIETLLQIEAERRDWDWVSEIDNSILNATFYIPDRPIAQAPSGFTFFWAYTRQPADFQQGRRAKLSEFLNEALEREAGVIVTSGPDKVRALSYGDLCYMNAFKRLYHPSSTPPPPASLKLEKGSQIAFGSPNESLFPQSARKIARKLMQELWNVSKPCVLLGYNKSYSPQYAITFNILDGNLRTDEEIDAAINMLSWVTPPCAIVASNSRTLMGKGVLDF